MFQQSRVSRAAVPLAVRFALCKLAFWQARYNQEIIAAFNFPKSYKNCYTEVKPITDMLTQYSLILLNKIYLNDTIDLNPELFDKSAHRFGVHADKMKFNRPHSSTFYINKWFESVSLRRLPDILEKGDIDNNTSVILLSAAHVQMSWEKSFNILKTKEETFRLRNGSRVKVPMMKRRDSIQYYHTADFQIVNIPLVTYGMSMTIVLPQNIGGYIGAFQVEYAMRNMKDTLVDISLPRFRIKSTNNYNEALKQMGIHKVFNSDNSGLHTLLKSHHDVKNLHVSLVKQKVFLDVDEMGPFRRIPSEQPLNLLPSQKRNIKEFTADHPFSFTINMDISTKGDLVPLLMGVYNGPD